MIHSMLPPPSRREPSHSTEPARLDRRWRRHAGAAAAAPDLKDGKPWSDADDDVLRASVAKGTGLIEVAAVLRRPGTPFEVYKRGMKLGLWPEGGSAEPTR